MSFERVRLALFEPTQAHQALLALWTHVKPWIIAGHRLHVEVRADTRSLAQNRLLWQRLADVAGQVIWHGIKLSADEWKDVFSAARKKQRVVPGLEGGFVVLGDRTSQLTVAEMTELLDLVDAFGAHQGVKFRDHEN
jgi:hypothetical protein